MVGGACRRESLGSALVSFFLRDVPGLAGFWEFFVMAQIFVNNRVRLSLSQVYRITHLIDCGNRVSS